MPQFIILMTNLEWNKKDINSIMISYYFILNIYVCAIISILMNLAKNYFESTMEK